MRDITKALTLTAIAVLTFAAPLASANEPERRSVSTRGGGENFIGSDPSRYNDGPSSYTRMKEARYNQTGRARFPERGLALMQKGNKAEDNGDNQKACRYYMRARQAFNDIGSNAGIADSVRGMDRTCAVQSS